MEPDVKTMYAIASGSGAQTSFGGRSKLPSAGSSKATTGQVSAVFRSVSTASGRAAASTAVTRSGAESGFSGTTVAPRRWAARYEA